MKTLNKTVKEVGEFFQEIFGQTPLTQRLSDIQGEAIELSRFVSINNIKEEAGDCICSLFALCHESGFDVEELIAQNREKILKRKNQYASLGRKTRVAILGGAFDPIHNGHIELAQFVLNTSKYFDEVWLMPAAAHAYGKQMHSAAHRLVMCGLAAKKDLRIKVSQFEIERNLKGETFQTAKLLIDFYKHSHEFSWIIGMDNANEAPSKWINFADLEKMMPFVVVPRIGQDRNLNVRWYLQAPHIFLEPDNKEIISNISSTVVRNNLIKNKEVENMIDSLVLEYIQKNNLYV